MVSPTPWKTSLPRSLVICMLHAGREVQGSTDATNFCHHNLQKQKKVNMDILAFIRTIPPMNAMHYWLDS